jgi:hypothetical protein
VRHSCSFCKEQPASGLNQDYLTKPNRQHAATKQVPLGDKPKRDKNNDNGQNFDHGFCNFEQSKCLVKSRQTKRLIVQNEPSLFFVLPKIILFIAGIPLTYRK